jgi:hypothetical protein
MAISNSAVIRTAGAPELRAKEILFALIVGFGFRLLMLWFVDVGLDGDAGGYVLMARNLIDHGIFSIDTTAPFVATAYRPPLYPAFGAVVFSVFGPNLLALQLAQVTLTLSGIGVVCGCIARLPINIARPALWLLVLSPFEAVYSVVFLSEAVAAFLLSTGVVGWLVVRGNLRWVIVGISFGLAALTRDIYLALPPFFAVLWVLWGEGSSKERTVRAILLVGVAVLIVAPWSIRNAVVLEKWAPISAGRLGFSLWTGGWTITFRDVVERDGLRTYPPSAYLDDHEKQQHDHLLSAGDLQSQDRFYLESFKRRLRQEPLMVLGRWIARIPLMWLGTRFDIFELNSRAFPRSSPPWYAVKLLLYGLNTVFVALGWLGVALAWHRRYAMRWLSVPLLFTVAVYLPLNSFENRYSQPVYPLLLLFTALALRDLLAWIKARKPGNPHAQDASPEPSSRAYGN